jgi:beta-xylosidase
MPLSDDFRADRFGIQWAFYDPGANEMARVRRSGGKLQVKGKGTSPSDCSPISCIAGDHSYRIECDVEVEDGAEAGLLLFYSRRLYAGLGFGPNGLVMHRYGQQRPRRGPVIWALRLRLTNDRNVLTIHTSADGGRTWTLFDVRMEVSGYHHNVAGDFLSLRPALYAAGAGEARFSNFTYEALA